MTCTMTSTESAMSSRWAGCSACLRAHGDAVADRDGVKFEGDASRGENALFDCFA
jgi:hypothetical protein